jgi:hypothetical protein
MLVGCVLGPNEMKTQQPLKQKVLMITVFTKTKQNKTKKKNF